MRFVDGSPEKNDKQLSVSSDDAINEKYAYSDHCSLNLSMDSQVLIPAPDEWDVSGLPDDRRHYLETVTSFEQIADMLLQSAVVLTGRMSPYRDRPKSVPTGTYQAIFQVRTDLMVYDLIYNAPDGLRGRYWQSPDRGYLATRLLIESLRDKLLSFARKFPLKRGDSGAEAKMEDVIASLNASSAKVWIREWDEGRNWIPNRGCPQIAVRRWAANERYAEVNKDTWRSAPIDDQIEIKGALIRPDGIEEIPEGKRDRSCAIHRFGFT